ncbi:hypothetical protein BH10PSE4_BH10PSE4_22200 [soil metagenome]
MARPTAMQQHHLSLLRFARIFGLIFAIGSVLAIASNIPGLIRGNIPGLAETYDGQGLPIVLVVLVGFPAFGILLFTVSGRALTQYRAYIAGETAVGACHMCKRPLGVEADPLSSDCGGDCWGCVGSIEADMGWEPSVEFIDLEIKAGLRNADGTAKPY